MPEPLNKTERRIFDYLVDYLKKNTYQPSIREIGKRFGIKSTKTVSEHLQALADKGYIERDSSRSRGVRILGMNMSPGTVSVPQFGKIAAGVPALLREDIGEEFELDCRLVGEAGTFFLQVKGDSMEGMGILDGDRVLVQPAQLKEIERGDIVAARVNGEATVKRFFARDGEIVLEPANTDYAPILVHEHEDFMILGRVVGLFRRFTPEQTQAIGA